MKPRRFLAVSIIGLCAMYVPAAEAETVLWATHTDKKAGHCFPQSTLMPNFSMFNGYEIFSKNKIFKLAFQTDGNLVLYRHPHNEVMWESRTYGKDAKEAIMQTDGNFVIYDGRGNAVWHTHTDGYPGAYLAVQCDGNVVIYLP